MTRRIIVPLCALVFHASTGCSSEPCLERKIEADAPMSYGNELVMLSGFNGEEESDDWEFEKAVIADITTAPDGHFVWVIGGGTIDFQQLVHPRLKVPRAVGERVTWDPSLDPDPQDLTFLNAFDRRRVDSTIIRRLSEGTAEIVSVDPLLIRLDLLFSPVATSSVTLEPKRMQGTVSFEIVGNARFCGS